MENNKLIIVIGEKPTNVPKEFSTIEIYYRTKNNTLEYYDTINTMYNYNYVESFFDIPEDPRYFLEEGHTDNGCTFRCVLKPLGTYKGLYRLIGGTPYKIRAIKPATEYEFKRK